MKKYLYLILILCTVSLTGCGTKDVVYDIEKSAEDNTAGEKTETKETKPKANSGDTLAAALGITDNHWKETIGSGTDVVFINADVEVPDVSAMYTLEVSEHYYTPEEQKKIAEYFLDADTIEVNKNKVVTKEWVKNRLDFYSTRMESIKEDEQEYDPRKDAVFMEWSENEKKMISNETKRLQNLMNEAPAISDVSTAVQDYSENYYKGSKDGVEYTLSFDMDEGRNISAWTLEALDGNDFSHKKVTQSKNWRYVDLNYNGDNLCEMTKEDACTRAEKLCDELGISNMKVAAVCALEIHPEYDSSMDYEEFLAENDYNGYHVELVRNIKGVAVDGASYRHTNKAYLETETEKTYDNEKVVVELNDKGIIFMAYQGCLVAKEVGNAVKLLSYEQIQEIFRKELSGSEGKRTIRYLYLGYTRVADEEKTNQYRYIPVWCLTGENPHKALGYGENTSGVFHTSSTDGADGDILLNAMDGSRIDPDKIGLIDYITPEKDLENWNVDFD